MSPKKAKRANELPYIPLGPFQWRIPGIHYRVEYVEFFQGLILGATALSSIPYLTDNLGLPYELAWSCVIIEVFMYMLHGWLGDPVVPGWITPTLPFTLAYLNGFEKGPDRIQAMIALQLLVAFVFIFMGITKLADKFVNGVPNSIKGGILIAAPITVLQGQLSDGSQLMTAPVATLAGTLLLAFLSFSPFCEKNRSKYKILDIMAKYGNLFPYLIAMVAGVALGELSKPVLELGTVIRIPDFSNIFRLCRQTDHHHVYGWTWKYQPYCLRGIWFLSDIWFRSTGFCTWTDRSRKITSGTSDCARCIVKNEKRERAHGYSHRPSFYVYYIYFNILSCHTT